MVQVEGHFKVVVDLLEQYQMVVREELEKLVELVEIGVQMVLILLILEMEEILGMLL